MFIDVWDAKKRIELVEFLEREGYNAVNEGIRTREWILEGKFPIIVRFEDKTIDRIGNVTCAAASVKSLKTLDEFYQIFKEKKENEAKD